MLEIYNADKESEKLIKKVYKAALKYFSQKDIFEVEIEIVDKDEIQSINKEARGVDAVTDVLSFKHYFLYFMRAWLTLGRMSAIVSLIRRISFIVMEHSSN